MCAAIASPEKLLSIRFMGLCTFVQDKKEDAEVKKVTVVMPDAVGLNKQLCDHRPYVIFKASDLAGTPDKSLVSASSFVTYDGVLMGLWDLTGLELRLALEVGSLPNRVSLSLSYPQILGYDDLTPGLGSFKGEWLDQKNWKGRILSSVVLTAGDLSSRKAEDPNPKSYSVGRRDGKNKRDAKFNQIVHYDLYGDAKSELVIIAGRDRAGKAQQLRFKKGSAIAITHLCAVGESDGDPNPKLEIDVEVAYEMSRLPVKLDERSVLHLETGDKTTPTSDACPPLRAYLG